MLDTQILSRLAVFCLPRFPKVTSKQRRVASYTHFAVGVNWTTSYPSCSNSGRVRSSEQIDVTNLATSESRLNRDSYLLSALFAGVSYQF